MQCLFLILTKPFCTLDYGGLRNRKLFVGAGNSLIGTVRHAFRVGECTAQEQHRADTTILFVYRMLQETTSDRQVLFESTSKFRGYLRYVTLYMA